MEPTFVNQLTGQEISRGISLHIKERLWPVILVAMVVAFTLAHYLFGLGTSVAAIAAIAGALIAAAWLSLSLGRNFSPEKKATYGLGEEALTVTGSDGMTRSFPYKQVHVTGDEDLLILRLGGGSFAILATRHLSPEQEAFLRSKV